MTPYEKTLRIEKLKMYYSGLKDGIQIYAHWKDGTQYVGTVGKTLRAAIIELNKEEEKRISELQEEPV
jgi:hypothetical protein